MDAKESVCTIHRTALFERCLDELRKKGGEGEAAANKTIEFISAVSGSEGQRIREKFSFTRHGEARIKHCRKIDLGGGYRLVCLLKDGQLVLLYAGSHDECSRWLMRNRRMNYGFKEYVQTVPTAPERANKRVTVTPPAVSDEEQCVDEYEAELMSRIDDAALRKVFSGIVNGERSDKEQ